MRIKENCIIFGNTPFLNQGLGCSFAFCQASHCIWNQNVLSPLAAAVPLNSYGLDKRVGMVHKALTLSMQRSHYADD